MKVYETNKTLISGAMQSTVQGISAANIAKATYFLRDKIYSDKHKAAVTEILCNAVDEHRKYSIKKPVTVFLSEAELVIRDYAKGLSDDDVMRVYFQYFESTKSDSNEGIGGFGIGAKAPSSYADTYQVVSYFGGKKTIFISAIDGYSCTASKIHVEDCDSDNTGMCVRIPLQQKSDFIIFSNLIKDLYKQIGFYEDKSLIDCYIVSNQIDFDDFTFNIGKLEEPAEFSNDYSPLREFRKNKSPFYMKDKMLIVNTSKYNWGYSCKSEFFNSSFFKYGTFFAYDGDICYRINLDSSIVNEYFCVLNSYKYIFLFKRGELPVLPSREGIEMTEDVKDWIKNRCKEISEEFDNIYISELKNNVNNSNDPLFAIFNKKLSNIFFNNILEYSNHPLLKPFKSRWFLSETDANTFYGSKHTYKQNVDILLRIVRNRRSNYVYSNSTVDKRYNDLHKSEPRVVIYAKEKILPSTISRENIIRSFFELITEKYGFDYCKDHYKNTQLSILVIWSDSYKNEFESKIKDLIEANIFRKDIDYFDMEDILKKYNKLKDIPIEKKTVNKTVSIIDPRTKNLINSIDFDKTLLLSPSEISNNDYAIPKQINNAYISDYNRDSFKLFSKLTGIKHIVTCYKNSEPKFIKAGCKKIDNFDYKKLILDIIKNNNIRIVTGSLFSLVKGYNKEVSKTLSTIDNNNYVIYSRYNDNDFIKINNYDISEILKLLRTYVKFNEFEYDDLVKKELENIIKTLTPAQLEDFSLSVWHETIRHNSFVYMSEETFKNFPIIIKTINDKISSSSINSVYKIIFDKISKINFNEILDKSITSKVIAYKK